jgi:hypothetical protein
VKFLFHSLFWRGVRVVDGDALEMRFGETQRGFKSPPLRLIYFMIAVCLPFAAEFLVLDLGLFL